MFLTYWRKLEKGVICFTSRGNEFQSLAQKNKENEYHIVWSGLGLRTGYHYLFDVYNINEQRMLAWSTQQNKMEFIYETNDEQK